MKTVIFAGGLGSRISEESHMRPKPMIEIAGKPILWHIMKMYQAHGFNEFIICLGYKGYMIKEYFINYFYHNSDITVDLANNQVEVHQTNSENFKVTLVDTGLHTMTAGRLQRIEKYIGEDESFMLTYGDGVSDVNIKALVDYHNQHDKIATVTTVQPAGKFGVLNTDANGTVTEFVEKPKGGGTWINGGFFVLNRGVFDYLRDKDMTPIMWEDDPMRDLVADNELVSYKHDGFWKCMDILRDKRDLERMWNNGNPAWKIW
ncbi:glucose-1-phosphate cytidylyltransferase [Aureispira anguillae]|uniref:Glucose-1-phosphate cytidylyltransferase n=1 Tax=Aureispira anguillae TaxID=2864201 RepID=A0A915YK25_9BACT|nr:glucose-1-phosphate cytidylyltransferase [Aureispira anguillae]BDS14672.1 glucose-1-phosphate cytidylyltransferase [Aureispira anguillae]